MATLDKDNRKKQAKTQQKTTTGMLMYEVE